MPAAPLLPPVPDEAAYRALYGDPSHWLPAIRLLCERHGFDPDAAFAAPRSTNVVFRITDGPWLKIFPPLWPQDFERERTGIAAVTGFEGLDVPQLLHEGELEGWPYLVLSNVEGRAIGEVWSDLDDGEKVDVARQCGELLARLHTVDLARCAPIREDWPTYARALRDDAADRQAGYGLDPAWVAELRDFIDALPPMDNGREVFLHADLTDEHIFLDRRDGRWQVTGLIDFGDAMVGDWRYEFAAPLIFAMQRRPAVQRALLEGYGLAPEALTPEFGNALVAWAFLHRWGRIASYAQFAPSPLPTSLAEQAEAIWSPA